MRQSVVAGSPAPKFTLNSGVDCAADDNWYDLSVFKFNEISYAADTFDAYRRASGQDLRSRWESISLENGLPQAVPSTVGVVPALLPSH